MTFYRRRPLYLTSSPTFLRRSVLLLSTTPGTLTHQDYSIKEVLKKNFRLISFAQGTKGFPLPKELHFR